MLSDAPEFGNEDPEFLALLDRARENTLFVEIRLTDPILRDDPDGVAERKAVTAASAWAQQHGAVFGGVLAGKQQRGRRSA